MAEDGLQQFITAALDSLTVRREANGESPRDRFQCAADRKPLAVVSTQFGDDFRLTADGRAILSAAKRRGMMTSRSRLRSACPSRPRGRAPRRTVRRTTSRSGSRGDPDLGEPSSRSRDVVA